MPLNCDEDSPGTSAARPAEVREGRAGAYCSTSRSAVMWHPGYRTVDLRLVLTGPRRISGKPDVRPPRLGRLNRPALVAGRRWGGRGRAAGLGVRLLAGGVGREGLAVPLPGSRWG